MQFSLLNRVFLHSNGPKGSSLFQHFLGMGLDKGRRAAREEEGEGSGGQERDKEDDDENNGQRESRDEEREPLADCNAEETRSRWERDDLEEERFKARMDREGSFSSREERCSLF